jgi:putative MFS transporter
MSTASAPAPEIGSLTRAQRLDRLPFNSQHRRLLVGSGVGWALDAMDVGLISFVMAALAKQWSLDATQQSWIGSIGFVGMAIGASVGGLLADRIGRRNVFALTLLVYGLATGAAGFSTGLAMLIALRFVVGLGLGAELPVASTLVSEYSPSAIRGRMVVILEAFWAVGWILAALIGYFIVPTSDNGWRWALFLGVVPAAYAAFVRSNLPESVRFLESKGRTTEAESAVRSFEAPSGIAPVDSPVLEPTPAPPWTDLWGDGLRGRTTALWLTWFGVNFSYYGAFIWIPSLLVAQGYSLTRSFAFTLIITLAQLPGYAVAAVLIEVWGRRATLASFLLGSAVSAIWFGQAGSEGAIIAAGCALSFFNLGAWGALYAVTPEVYPTPLRATGAGSAAAFGRIASILAPLSVPWLKSAGGTGLVFGVFGAAFVLAALAALGLPEWRGRTLEE